jgi:hypothetical protein
MQPAPGGCVGAGRRDVRDAGGAAAVQGLHGGGHHQLHSDRCARVQPGLVRTHARIDARACIRGTRDPQPVSYRTSVVNTQDSAVPGAEHCARRLDAHALLKTGRQTGATAWNRLASAVAVRRDTVPGQCTPASQPRSLQSRPSAGPFSRSCNDWDDSLCRDPPSPSCGSNF